MKRGQLAVMWRGRHPRHAWHVWHSRPAARHPLYTTAPCLCGFYRFSPEQLGHAEVWTQQFRHFHPETKDPPVLVRFPEAHLCCRLPQPAHPAPVLTSARHLVSPLCRTGLSSCPSGAHWKSPTQVLLCPFYVHSDRHRPTALLGSNCGPVPVQQQNQKSSVLSRKTGG